MRPRVNHAPEAGLEAFGESVQDVGFINFYATVRISSLNNGWQQKNIQFRGCFFVERSSLPPNR